MPFSSIVITTLIASVYSGLLTTTFQPFPFASPDMPSVLEGSKGLLHSFWSSRPPRSTSIRAEQANLRSCCYAFGAGRQGQPPFPAAATHLMVATKNAWNAPRGAGADQPCERVKATDTARCGNLWGQPQRCYLSRNGDRYPGQRWAEATESGCSSCPHRGLATKGRNWT